MLKQSCPDASQSDRGGIARVADLYMCPDKAELINGNLVRMPPTGATYWRQTVGCCI